MKTTILKIMMAAIISMCWPSLAQTGPTNPEATSLALLAINLVSVEVTSPGTVLSSGDHTGSLIGLTPGLPDVDTITSKIAAEQWQMHVINPQYDQVAFEVSCQAGYRNPVFRGRTPFYLTREPKDTWSVPDGAKQIGIGLDRTLLPPFVYNYASYSQGAVFIGYGDNVTDAVILERDGRNEKVITNSLHLVVAPDGTGVQFPLGYAREQGNLVLFISHLNPVSETWSNYSAVFSMFPSVREIKPDVARTSALSVVFTNIISVHGNGVDITDIVNANNPPLVQLKVQETGPCTLRFATQAGQFPESVSVRLLEAGKTNAPVVYAAGSPSPVRTESYPAGSLLHVWASF